MLAVLHPVISRVRVTAEVACLCQHIFLSVRLVTRVFASVSTMPALVPYSAYHDSSLRYSELLHTSVLCSEFHGVGLPLDRVTTLKSVVITSCDVLVESSFLYNLT